MSRRHFRIASGRPVEAGVAAGIGASADCSLRMAFAERVGKKGGRVVDAALSAALQHKSADMSTRYYLRRGRD